MFKPLGNRAILKITKNYLMDGKKPILDEQGNPVYEQEQIATVMSSNITELKKGDKVIPIIRGGVPVYSEETKKYVVVIIDGEDIYAKC
jgi:hypothetical protein